MKGIKLTMEKQEQYEVIKAVAEGRKSKLRASIELGVTKRHINRLVKRYIEEGKTAFVHGNTGRKPKHALSDEQKKSIAMLYNKKYFDANFTHATELMGKYDAIRVSPSTLRKIMLSYDVLSPKARRSTVKALKKRLRNRQAVATKKEAEIIETKIISAEMAHSRRPRVAHYGELIQMDASPHKWFANEVTHLHIAIDDHSGRILAAYFDKEETLNGYYHLLHQILTTEGIPYKFLTDNRTVFNYKRKNSPSDHDDVPTQFGYACKQLGISIDTTSVPQGKGRIERANQTLQSRFVTELRLLGVDNIKKANEVLPILIENFNSQFAIPVDYTKSVFETQPPEEKINLILSVISERTVDNGQCIKYNNKYYKLIDDKSKQVNLRPHTKGLVAKTFNGNLYFTVDNIVYALEEVPIQATISENFDTIPEDTKERKIYIPPQNHPWRNTLFFTFKKKIASKYYLEC